MAENRERFVVIDGTNSEESATRHQKGLSVFLERGSQMEVTIMYF